MWILYQCLLATVLAVSAPFLLVRRWRHYRPTLAGRLGRSSEPEAAHPLWIHAVSVGEVEVARTVLASLRERCDQCGTLLTTVTPTGQARARKSLPADVRVGYLPFELGFAQRRFLANNRPGSLVLVEGELWPLLLRNVRRRRLPVVMVNGRISDRSFARLRRLQGLLGPLLDPVDHFGVQSGQDRDRLETLGVASSRITVTGNVKYDAPPAPRIADLERMVGSLAEGRPVLVAGSTMPGEDELVLDAFEQLGDLDPLLVLAPRHPERFDDVFELCRQRQLDCSRRSHLVAAAGSEGGAPNGDTGVPCQVLLLDTLGELASCYGLAAGAFVGGTLVPTGGHNPIEPARCAAPTCVGPSMENFHEVAAQFDDADAWRRVTSVDELAACWRVFVEQPGEGRAIASRATRLLEENRGAAERSARLISRWAPATCPRAEAPDPPGGAPAPDVPS